jgi:hypothetical protein
MQYEILERQANLMVREVAAGLENNVCKGVLAL